MFRTVDKAINTAEVLGHIAEGSVGNHGLLGPVPTLERLK